MLFTQVLLLLINFLSISVEDNNNGQLCMKRPGTIVTKLEKNTLRPQLISKWYIEDVTFNKACKFPL